ncbi:T9SS type A sorting domain-containing protein, partial [Mangrovimonas aestuarii]|uniref:T9SS type A sorting domain-containing protein n=1 Tax=Mangrovimonas aestuarii TaxID=3018443 RepID=UPI0023798273
SPSETTTYTVTGTSGSATDTDQVVVNINALPEVNAGNDVTITSGDNVTLTATGNGTFEWSNGETGASITVSPSATTTYTVTASNNSCTAEDTVTVTVNEPTAPAIEVSAGPDVTICEGNSVTLTATGADSYEWSNGETGASITVSPFETITYTVTGTSGEATGSDQVVVTVNPLPEVNAGNDITITEGQSITLTATGIGNFEWNNGETGASITVSPMVTTTYTVTATNNSCSTTDMVTVTVVAAVPPVEAYAGEDVDLCKGESITLTATGGTEYLWSTGETSQSIIVSPNSTTTYTVTVSDGITSDTDDVKVFVSNCNSLGGGGDTNFKNDPFGIKVYPNPTYDVVNLQVTGAKAGATVQLFDMKGTLLMNTTLSDVNENGETLNTFNLSQYPKGFYLLTVTQDGAQETKKIILK